MVLLLIHPILAPSYKVRYISLFVLFSCLNNIFFVYLKKMATLKKQGLEEQTTERYNKIRITATSREVKNLEKGLFIYISVKYLIFTSFFFV